MAAFSSNGGNSVSAGGSSATQGRSNIFTAPFSANDLVAGAGVVIIANPILTAAALVYYVPKGVYRFTVYNAVQAERQNIIARGGLFPGNPNFGMGDFFDLELRLSDFPDLVDHPPMWAVDP